MTNQTLHPLGSGQIAAWVLMHILETIKSKETGKTFITAEDVIVAVHKDGKLYRRIPEPLYSIFEREIKCPQLV